MRRAEIVAFMGSVTTRRDVREQTLRNLRGTDWGVEPRVVLDRARHAEAKLRSTDTIREALERAAQTAGWDLVLFLEDDLEFNRHLRHNLLHWPPILDLEPDAHFCASLYDPGIGSLDPTNDGATHRIVEPMLAYGSQAVVLSRPTVNWILDGFRNHYGLGDIRVVHLAARKTPVHYHLPSLVQHRQVPSHWGGVAHHAENFSEDFRAVERS